MTPSSNQLSLPFRRSAPLSLSTAIRQYISKKYDQHPDMFRHDLEVVDALRRDAINVREAHASGIKKLQAYAAQLVWISGKFPIDVCLHLCCPHYRLILIFNRQAKKLMLQTHR